MKDCVSAALMTAAPRLSCQPLGSLFSSMLKKDPTPREPQLEDGSTLAMVPTGTTAANSSRKFVLPARAARWQTHDDNGGSRVGRYARKDGDNHAPDDVVLTAVCVPLRTNVDKSMIIIPGKVSNFLGQ